MENNTTISAIKSTIQKHIGEDVTLRSNGGRKKILVNDGVIDSVYHNIFVIKLKDDSKRKVTYSYSDVLTKTVQLVFPSSI